MFPNTCSRVRVIIRVRLENMGPRIPEKDKHPAIAFPLLGALGSRLKRSVQNEADKKI